MIKLYYWPGYCSLATHITLNWLRADFELEKVDLSTRQSQAFINLNPSSTVPVIVVGDWVLSQNVAILNYLADTHPDAKLNGDGSPESRAQVNRWLAYINSDVHKSFSPLHHPERIQGDSAVIEATQQLARSNIRRHLEVFDKTLEHREWLLGAGRSIADPYLFVMLRWALLFKIDFSGMPHLTRYFDELCRDREVIRSLDEESSGKRLGC